MADCTCNVINGLVYPGVINLKQFANESEVMKWVLSSRYTKDGVDLTEFDAFLVLQRGDSGEIDESELIMDYDKYSITLSWDFNSWMTRLTGYVKYQIVFRGKSDHSELRVLAPVNLAQETGYYLRDNEGVTNAFYRTWSHANKNRQHKVSYDFDNNRWQLTRGSELIAYQEITDIEPFNGVWNNVLVGCTAARVWNSGEAVFQISDSIAADQNVTAGFPTILRQMWLGIRNMIIKSGLHVEEIPVAEAEWESTADGEFYIKLNHLERFSIPAGAEVAGVQLWTTDGANKVGIGNTRIARDSATGETFVYSLSKVSGVLSVFIKGGNGYVFVSRDALEGVGGGSDATLAIESHNTNPAAHEALFKQKVDAQAVVNVNSANGEVSLSVEANARYVVKSAITKLTVTSVANSNLESEIQFTAGSSITVELPASLGVIGEPSFEAGKSYIISVKNNIAVAAEYTPGVSA